MIPYEDMYHDPTSESIVDVLMQRNGNISDNLFYRVLVAFYMGKVASMMRSNVMKFDKQIIPINVYALNLMPSGFGKGLATNVIESNILYDFRHEYLETTFPVKATENLTRIASKRAIKECIDEDEALEQVGKEFTQLGQLMFSFDSGTPAALKQMRLKLLMGNAGSMNFHIDEIGSNLQKNQEMLEVFLELYDVGKVKQKLIKNTAENVRLEDMEGCTPSNLLMFGTPSNLLDGGRTEDLLIDFFETGYARRCLFGLVDTSKNSDAVELSAEEILEGILNSNTDRLLNDLSDHFATLADLRYFGKLYTMSREVSLVAIEYQKQCKSRSEALPVHDSLGKAEMLHRHFKAIKIAGAYAFCSASPELTLDHMYSAIKLCEDSGTAFRKILNRDRNYVRLAKYIATINTELTQADLVEDLPFYKGTNAVKNEMMQLATAWGYANNIVIKKKYVEGVELISGETLAETDLNKLILSHSNDLAYNYMPEYAAFTELHNLTQIPKNGDDEYNWCNHHLTGGHREGVNAIKGFNMIVLDIDDGCDINTAKLLLKDYVYHMYTTKRHTEEKHRFRIVMPISHAPKLSGEEYKEFMANVFEWLPFTTDEQTGHRVCKWASNEGEYWYNTEGEILDALQFIPSTSKNDKRKQRVQELSNLDNLERWFALRMTDGTRNNEMIRFALMLVDGGMSIDQVEDKVRILNDKLKNPLPEDELGTTILRTVAKRYQENS